MSTTTTTAFAYEAIDKQGALQKGVLESESAERVAQVLASRSLIPISVTTHGEGLHRDIKLPGFRSRTTVMDLGILCRQAASMTSSGLSLVRSLGILEDQAVKPGLKAALRKVRLDVQGGSTLSNGLSQHVEHFPPLMIDMVKAGETGGFLDEALARVATMYEGDAELRGKIKSALTYPVIVLIFSLLMGTGVIIFIVPIFERMFASLGGKLPLPTQILVTLSHNMFWVLPILIVGFIVTTRTIRTRLRKDPVFALRFDKLRLRLPVFGTLFTKLALSRWARNLATLISVGVPLLQALEIVGGTSGSGVISAAMTEVRDGVRSGHQMSSVLAQQPIFPNMVVQMLEVGEETGQVVNMLDKVSDYYDREVETATESLASALEPVMVVLMGIVIGAMVVCLYLPMFTIYKNIQGN
jgi:type IV pilus assembly protein PilC